jgi:putative MATE family efflux protein
MTVFNEKIIDVTKGNIWAGIWKLSWPMLLIMIFSFFVGFTDVYVAGFISPNVQAAVGFVTQIYFLVVIVANAIGIGTLALISRAIGAGETQKAVDIAKQSLILSFLIAVALTVVCLLFYRGIISLAGFPLPIRDIAETFIKVFAFALGPNYVLIISNAIFRASAEVNKPLITMFILCLTNILLDFFLVFGIPPFPRLGYAGIAYSTAISTVLGTIINLFFLGISTRWRPVFSNPLTLSFKTIKVILNIGWPAAFLQIAWNMTSIILYNILGRLKESSITALASITNGLRIEAIIFLPAFALNMAASVIIGQNLGAGDPTGEPAVIAETVRYLRFNMLSEPFMALSTVMGGGLQGAGDTKGPMWVIIISMWLIRLPLASSLSFMMGFGASGVWAAMLVSMICQGVMMAWWFQRGRWKKLKLQ